ncbi:MAG: DUF3037 domain-containing protein [Acetobacter fabarum]|uniref:DUF3037 domain-containing protein n=1 Tax=Acetobacter fabarum TaxID=483199 RepID=UPI0039EA311A
MAHCFKFAIVRLSSDDVRDERLNIGAVVLSEDGLDVRVPRRLDKVRAMSGALDRHVLSELVCNLQELDKNLRDANMDWSNRLKFLSKVGPISLSKIGTFVAQDQAAYEERLAGILKAMVEPEPAPVKVREKRSSLLTQIKGIFRQERVLAKKDEGIDSHRIVSSYSLDEGLVADLVLKNGFYHVVETIDVSGEDDTVRKAVSEIGISALVLERARMKFGEAATRARLVYNANTDLEKIAKPSLDAVAHQNAELINWASHNDRLKFVHSLASLASPFEQKKKPKKPTILGVGEGFKFH